MRSKLVLAFVVAAVGCGGGGSGGAAQPATATRTTRGSANLITEAEIRATAYPNAMEIVQTLRPSMLTPRPGGGPVMLYLDDVKMTDLNGLTSVPTERVKEIRYINSRDATTRWGTGHSSGVILVTTKR